MSGALCLVQRGERLVQAVVDGDAGGDFLIEVQAVEQGQVAHAAMLVVAE
ncbi:hypothetical protein [Actinacidiphila sp. ITFR-21]|nr:hypothetical protein [Streptomyces sp. ITFR-21]WNI15462.1 hypothetical protein RLT57_07915 [Streptomyces sp. ITFR-21]